MATEFQALRATLVEKRDAYARAIEALDHALALSTPMFPVAPSARRGGRRSRLLPGAVRQNAAKKNGRTEQKAGQRAPREPP